MKKTLIAVGVVLLVVVGALIFAWSSMDGIVKTAIETFGSEATQTQVTVAKVKIKLQDGSGSISGLNVGNPEGFTDKNIFQLGAISTKIDTSTVTQNPVVIDEVIISSPKVFYEIDASGASNLDALKRNLEALSSPSSAPAAENSKGGDEIKVVIRRLIVEGGEAKMRIAALGGKQMTVSLPRIEMKDIGKESGGASPLDVAKELTGSMVKNVQGAVMGGGANKYLGKSMDALGDVGSAVGGAAGSAGDQIGGAVKGLFGK